MPSSGPNYAGTISTASYTGGVDWTNAANVGADDNTYATVAIASKSSYYLKCQNFGFSIPTGSTINGITVAIGAFASNGGTYADVYLLGADGTQVGDDKGTGNIPASEGPTSFGGTSDTWNATPTAAMVNDTDFGVVLRVYNGGMSSSTISVDHVRVTITYTVAAVTCEGTLRVGAISAAGEGTVAALVGFTSWPLRWLGTAALPTGEGTLQVGPVTMAGEGIVIVPVSGTGTLLVGATSIYGEGVVAAAVSGDGTLAIGDISISGEGVVLNNITVVGGMTAGTVSISGVGLVALPVTSEGTLAVAAVSVSGTGTVTFKFNITFYRKYKPTTFTVSPRTSEFSMSNRGATIYVPARTRTFVAPSRT